ncbi:MAG TPA: phosphotransferase [Mobilitalea sp.]|nr:phosphotransferase [Mobilitalea sp.]
MSLGRLIGKGNTADVFEWEDDKVLKLFHMGYPKDAIEKEYNNAVALRNMNFKKPKVYDMIPFEERWGIIYEKTLGETMLDWLIKTGDMEKCAFCMADLHKQILSNKTDKVPYYKDFLKNHIPRTLKPDKQNELLQRIERLEDGNDLCHGDFHPGNILISDGNFYVIDFMNICYGPCLYDIARTVFLLEFSEIPDDAKNNEQIIQFRKELADLYLSGINITRDMIRDYLEIVGEIRKGECV